MLKEHIRQAEEDAKSAVCLGEQAENVGFGLGGAHLAKVVLFSLGILGFGLHDYALGLTVRA